MKWFVFTVVLLVLFSCGTPVMKTVYSNPKPPASYKKILVIAIMPEKEMPRERQIESTVIYSFGKKGLEGISFTDAFSIYDTCQPCLDAFYFALEERNIDGILTISKLPSSGAVPTADWHSLAAAPFYLQHVWKYKSTQEIASTFHAVNYFWEMILFDVHSLETTTVLQSKPAGASRKTKKTGKILEEIINTVNALVSKEPVLNERPKLAF